MARHVAIITTLLLSGCALEGAEDSVAGLRADDCDVWGMGIAANGEFFMGHVRGDGTSVEGGWMHIGDSVVLGGVDFLDCRANGLLGAEIQGPATLNGVGGYNYRISIRDGYVPPGPVEGPTEIQTITATRRYRPTRWDDGHVAIDEKARVTIPAELPVTVGNAGNQWAWLTFKRPDDFGLVNCRYRGGASKPNPKTPSDIAAGEAYHFDRCIGDRDEPIEPGDRVEVSWMKLRVLTGAHFFPTKVNAETTVSVDLEVTPISMPWNPDLYGIGVWDDVTGERVYHSDGLLLSGEIHIRYD